MKFYNKILSISLVFALAFGVTQISHAQDDPRSEAVSLYNEAQDLANSQQFADAIEVYREALEIATENEFEDIIEQIEERIPRVYSSRASTAYRAYQDERTIDNANRALEYFKDAKDAGEEFGSQRVVEQATGAIPQLYYVRSVVEYREELYDDAHASLDSAIELNPNYAAAFYQKALVYNRATPDDMDTIFEYFDRAIELAQESGDNRTLDNARSRAAQELVYRAANLADEDRFTRAVEMLERVEQYDPEYADAYYRLAEISNERGNWEEAIRHANRALEYESGGVVEQAKIYFELGTAYKGMGDTSNACEAFENANYGDFSDPASHELEFELECEGYASSNRR